MDFFSIVDLVGGLALFLYGMSTLGSGLERLSGGRLEKTLEKMTSNVIKSVLLGALVTGAIQSSSATTVIVVGLVNAGILKLKQAIGVIMGANIGTTVTAQILRLSDLDSGNFFIQFLKPTTLAPIAAVVGIIFLMASKKSRQKDIGQILLGFGVLFTGMFSMEAAVRPLSDMPQFAELFAALSNPILGVIVGALVTALIQSSSASIGILQALSSTGLITFSSAFPIIMGQNIGTCITPILASIGANKNAKRSACVHLAFNVIGTAIFLVVTYAIQYTIGFPFWDDVISRGGIANFHTLFNVVTTVLFIPFVGLLEKLANHLIKSDEAELSQDAIANNLDERFLVSPGLALNQARETVLSMANLAEYNFNECSKLLRTYDAKTTERIKENENIIDKMEDRLDNYLLRLTEKDLTEPESREISELLQVMSEFERVGDYSVNIMEQADYLYDNDVKFSDKAHSELAILSRAVSEIIGLAVGCFGNSDLKQAAYIEPLEETIDAIIDVLKFRHIDRLKLGQCTVDAGVAFLETLTNIERISDHCSNVAVYVMGHEGTHKGLDRHEYIRLMHSGQNAVYSEKYREYTSKYYETVKNLV
ncbi:Na/Pi cotransporter family protein [Zongyangia hominis]|uniref:Na/Pi cotransporter family protein n=1 Tax=Zongyangia hominis TaxID=2763677 RepID=A0A926I7G1_9FIRM|nr:Na/Pi cotransporter family protein [Zongyangia hominis]MBC8571064.1 Na/Pi cotransporter family protein [Zongyangia hominis]